MRKFLSLFSILLLLFTWGHLGEVCGEWMKGNLSAVHVLDESLDQTENDGQTAWLEIDNCGEPEIDDIDVIHEPLDRAPQAYGLLLPEFGGLFPPEPDLAIPVPPIERQA